MNLIPPNPARLLARAVHAVVREYQAIEQQPAAGTARTELSCTQARTEQGPPWPRRAPGDGRVHPPFAAGFGKPDR